MSGTIERQHLSILREIERCGSLTAAAKSLHLTQSALTHSIKKLEAAIATPLWKKQGRGLELTQAGRYLLAAAQRILPQIEQTEAVLEQIAAGARGSLRIGIECHPCYRWLLRVVPPFLDIWPNVDIDVRQKFAFGGMGALFAREIDVLITPDPLKKRGVAFEPVFSYEQVLVVHEGHALASKRYVTPEDLSAETLITYPVEMSRLDVFVNFLSPAGCSPHAHKQLEATDIMLQLVVAGRGVTAMPDWLVAEYQHSMPLSTVRLGREGVHKQLFVGVRRADLGTPYVVAFLQLARDAESREATPGS